MPTLNGSDQAHSVLATTAVKPLDEAVWQAWVAKGRAQDRRSYALRLQGVKWVSIAGLLAAAGAWSHLAPFEVALRMLVMAGAIVVMLQALQSRQYAVAGVFGALALIYNPGAPAFSLSGDWQRAAVVATVVPFVMSIVWGSSRNVRTEQHD